MYGQRPVLDMVLAGFAGSVFAVLLWLPRTPYLAPALRPLALALTAAWCVWRLWCLDSSLRIYTAWRINRTLTLTPAQVADYANDGLLLGHGFAWQQPHTQILELALAVTGALPVAQDTRGGSPALDAVGQAVEQAVVLPWDHLSSHLGLIGTTGSGKTVALETLATGAIAGPGAVVAIDPKGSRTLLARCAVEAQRRGKPFVLLAPAFPARSARMNVLATARTPAEVSARIHALMPSGGGQSANPFFERYPLAVIGHIAAAQQALGQSWTLEGIYRPAVFEVALQDLTCAYLRHLGYYRPPGTLAGVIAEYRKQGGDDMTADALIDMTSHKREHYQEIMSNLIPAFAGLVGEPLGALFSTVEDAVTWEQIVEKGMVVYIALASLLLDDVANRIGRVILQDLVNYLGTVYAYKALPAPPLTILIDEFHEVLYPAFPRVLAMSREAGARFIVAQQSLADTEAAMGTKALAARVLDNLGTRLYYRLGADDTAQAITEGMGTCTVLLPEESRGIGYGGVGGLTGQARRQLQPKEVPLVRQEWTKALPTGEAFVRGRGQVLKLRTPLLTPLTEAEIDGVGLLDIWRGLDVPALTRGKEQVC